MMIENIEKADGTPVAEDVLSLRDLRSFVAVAQAGGVTRAARELGYAQATLSAHVAALEATIGVPLIEPGRRGAPLTAAGRAVLARAETLLLDAAALQRDARSQGGRTTIRLAVSEPIATYRLPSILANFSRKRPEIAVELRVAGHVTAPALVESGRVDVAISARPERTRGGKPLAFEPVYEEHMLVLLRDDHRLARAKSVTLADLGGETLLVGSDVCAYRALVVSALRNTDIDVALRVRFGDGPTLAHGVAAGLGLAVLPAGFFAGGSPAPGVVGIPLRPRITIGIGIIEQPRSVRDEPLRALLQAICDGLSRTQKR